MDNEAIMDQIVRSLSFEVVAVPQNGIQVDSTSKSTPLNVKIRVRKKHGAELRHGVLSMPKVDAKRDSQRNEVHERFRLVSSDQTIMNFNVLMEADFDKSHHKQNLAMISPDLETKIEDDLFFSENTNNLLAAPIFTKRNKDIFGRCKPGGCLDPPFGEDKYSYQPAQQNIPLPVKNDATKLRSSSIFKNNIFKRKKKNSQSDDEFNEFDRNNKNKVDSIKNLNEKYSLETSPYSNAIITYPHPSDCNEFHKQEEKKVNREEEQSYRKIYSNEERSKTSSIEDGSYFMIPKKTKNLSNQSDSNKMPKNYTKSGENNLISMRHKDKTKEFKNILHTTANPENVADNKTDESKRTSHAHTFIPIPLTVPLKATINSKPTSNKMLDINSEVENNIQPSDYINQEKVKTSIQTEIMTIYDKNNLISDQKNLTLPEIESLNNSDPGVSTENEMNTSNQTQILRSIEPQDKSAHIFVIDDKKPYNSDFNMKQDKVDELPNKKDPENDYLDNSQHHMLLTIKENLNKSNASNVKDTIYDIKNKTDLKNHLLFADAREKSIMDITTDLKEEVKANSIQKQNSTIKLSEFKEKHENVPLSLQYLNQIWENKTEALKSSADVITTKTMIPTKYNDTSDDNNFKDDMKQKEQPFLLELISATDLQAKSVIPSSIHSTKISLEDMIKESLFDSPEKNLTDKTNLDDVKSLEILNEILRENNIENNDYKYDSGTHINKNNKNNVTQGEFLINTETLQQPKIEQNINEITNKNEPINSMKLHDLTNTSDHIDKYDDYSNNISSLKTPSENIEKQNATIEPPDDLRVSKVEEMIDIAVKEKSIISFSEDDNVTVKGLFPYKSKKSVSVQSIIGSGSSTYNEPDASGNQDNKSLKINLSSNFEEEKTSQNQEAERLNSTIFKETPYRFSEREKPELKTQLDNVNDVGELSFGLDMIPSNYLPEVLHRASNGSQPTSILRTGVVPWKIDIALQSYTDENNERVIKSFDSKNVPKRRLNDTLLVAGCHLGEELNEIKIPIDEDNNLSVKVVNIKTQHRALIEFNNTDNSTNELFEKKKIKGAVSDKFQYQSQRNITESSNVSDKYGKKKIKIDVPISDSDIVEEYTDYELNKLETNRHNKAIMSGDIRNALNSIYEEELVPLQCIIKGLREEIDALVAYQMKFKVQNLPPKRTKPLRLVHPHKKCCCFKRL